MERSKKDCELLEDLQRSGLAQRFYLCIFQQRLLEFDEMNFSSSVGGSRFVGLFELCASFLMVTL